MVPPSEQPGRNLEPRDVGTGEFDVSIRLYEELRRAAQRAMRNERAGHTFQTTDVVNEALGRLLNSRCSVPEDRDSFVRLAATKMRQVLVDHARARNAQKRGGGQRAVTLVEPAARDDGDALDVLALHEALERLGSLSERQAQVVELRYFAGLTLAEAASAMGIGRETAKDHWSMARAWLNRELTK